METAILWPLVLLTVSSFRAGATNVLTTGPHSGDPPSVQQQLWDNGLGPVVAQLVREQIAMAAKQQAIETTLGATQKELEATKIELETTKTELQATKTEPQTTKTDLQATKIEPQTTKTELQATKSELQATKSELQATKTELQATKSELQATKTELQATKTELEATKTKLEVAETKLETTETSLNATKTQLETNGASLKTTMSRLQNTTYTSEPQAFRADVRLGSSFVRWGRKTCPNNTVLVYEGLAGGKQFDHKGSGTNPLCLTKTPQFDDTPKPSQHGHLYGAEYHHISLHHNHDVPCSVCHAPQSTTIMVPATLSCPPGWTPQYSGHLASQCRVYHATEYVCLDGSPEDVHNTYTPRDENGLLFLFVVTVCGSLPCPPYIKDRVVTCVVCSK